MSGRKRDYNFRKRPPTSPQPTRPYHKKKKRGQSEEPIVAPAIDQPTVENEPIVENAADGSNDVDMYENLTDDEIEMGENDYTYEMPDINLDTDLRPATGKNPFPLPRKFVANPLHLRGKRRKGLDLSNSRLIDDPRNFLEKVNDGATVNKRYNQLIYKSAFHLVNMNQAKNPGSLLRHIFKAVIDMAEAAAKKHLPAGNHQIGIRLENKNLTSPIFRPFRPIDSRINSAISLLREFSKAQQSTRNGSLLNEMTVMEVSVIGDTSGAGRNLTSKV